MLQNTAPVQWNAAPVLQRVHPPLPQTLRLRSRLQPSRSRVKEVIDSFGECSPCAAECTAVLQNRPLRGRMQPLRSRVPPNVPQNAVPAQQNGALVRQNAAPERQRVSPAF